MRRGSRRALWGCLGSLAFAASCGLLTGPALRLADPATHRPLEDESVGKAFPVLVVEGRGARVRLMEEPRAIPPPPLGASYLVPEKEAPDLERYLRDHETTPKDSVWTLRVKALSPDRQEIELVRIGDGYWGGVYEATATTATAKYRKVTGPGFAFIVGPLALLLNGVLWAVGAAGLRLLRRRRRATPQTEPFGGPGP